jgi:hypothetical protein
LSGTKNNICDKDLKEIERWLNCNKKSLPDCQVNLTFLFDTSGNNNITDNLERALKCEHCDVNAYYKLRMEYFNDSEILRMYLCIKCVKIESKKIVDDFPAVRSLRVEPIVLPTILAI